MTKRQISIGLVAFMILTNIYLIWRVNSNTMAIASYDAGISQNTGVGKFESYWTKYIGGRKNSAMTYEDRSNAEADSSRSIIILFLLDIAIVGGIIYLNRKPKPQPVQTDDDDDDWRNQQRSRRRR